MAKATHIQPPFAWLGRYAAGAGLVSAVGLGAAFRFWDLNSLPPGLYNTTATTGLQALDLIEHGTLPGFTTATGYNPLWVFMQALMIKLLGHTALALRIWPAILGTLAVITLWLWVRSWFGVRVAWLAAFLLAVTPWAVTISRDGTAAALYPLLITLTLWLATLVYRKANLANCLSFAVVMVINLFAGPFGWLTAALVLTTSLYIVIREHKVAKLSRNLIIAVTITAVGLATLAYFIGTALDQFKHLPSFFSITTSIPALFTNLIKTLLMFNVYGDENYRHNLATVPMLNAFVGLMLVAGVLVGISRLLQRRYRLVFWFSLITLIPAVASTTDVPNAVHAVALLPFILLLAAIGISYMLELWYATFPINSAARLTGQSAIIVLLGLTLFQGYTQYFRAWAGAGEVYSAFDEGAVGIADTLTTAKFSGPRFVVAPPDQLPVVAYLSHGNAAYQPVQPNGIAGLPATPGPRQFLIAAASRDAAVRALKTKFPGGVLRPQYSTFNQAEIYYLYDTTQ